MLLSYGDLSKNKEKYFIQYLKYLQNVFYYFVRIRILMNFSSKYDDQIGVGNVIKRKYI